MVTNGSGIGKIKMKILLQCNSPGLTYVKKSYT